MEGRALKSQWKRGVLILSIVLNSIFVAIAYSSYYSKEQLKKNIISNYIYNQANERDLLKLALTNKEKKEEFVGNISFARTLIFENRNIVTNGSPLGSYVNLYENQWLDLFEKQKDDVLRSIQTRAVKGELSQDDYNKILKIIGELDKYYMSMDVHDKNLNKESLKKLTNKIEAAIKKVMEEGNSSAK
jgi:hypothetical protein